MMTAFPRLSRSNRRSSLRRLLRVETLETRALLAAVAAPSGLVSWWSANSNGADVMGLNNAALINGTALAAAEVGKGFSFDGVNDWASLGDPSSLAFTSSFSIEGWIKVNALNPNANFETIMFRGDNRGGLDPYQLEILPTGELKFGINGTSGGTSVTAASVSAPVPVGQLVHVAATLEDATGLMKLYENGVAVAEANTPIRPFRDLDPTQSPGVGIGNSNSVSNYNVPFNGLIDELSVYNRALTPGEVLNIVKAGSSGKVFSPIEIVGSSVVEGSAGTTTSLTFAIQRTGSLAGPLTVAWATADDTAAAGSDYVAASGAITFADGQATQSVTIVVSGDNSIEPTETLKLIATPAGGTSVLGIGTIVADDASISIADASATEGGSAYRFTDNFVSPGTYGLAAGRNLQIGPADGNIYVASLDTDSVKVFDPTTGVLLRDLSTPGGEMDGPWGMVFGPDGGLYVGAKYSQNILRFDVVTGASTVVVATANGGLGVPRGLAFGSDGSLYASSHDVTKPSTTDSVKRYDVTTGAYLGDFVAAGSGGLNDANGLVFGPDGNLYVASNLSSEVKRYNGQTGAFIDNFVTSGAGGLIGPRQLLFRGDGYLYVAADGGGVPTVSRYNTTAGAFVDNFASSTSLTKASAGGLAFASNGEFYVAANTPTGVFGSSIARFAPASVVAITATLSVPMAVTTAVDYSTADGSAVAGADYIARSGTFTFAPGETSKTVLVPSVDNTNIELAETFSVILSNPIGAVIATGTGTGTILDNDTKFYVVNDGSSDQTFEYGTNGASGEYYGLGATNTAPRGAASTAAGATVWVVDANKTVYVYNSSGALQGSWSAGGLNSAAQVEGIATDGNDVWLLDNKLDKVYKYTGAAARLSGSQSASSSFSLSSADTNGKGIVTDGTSLWVVDDGTSSDKVYKYAVSGTSKGSWTIDVANSHPTGLTINPASASDIWIVDNGTSKVYQYAAAANRTSGSQNAIATFALAAGNTNAQDIADPPVGAAATMTSVTPDESVLATNPETVENAQAAPMVLGIPATSLNSSIEYNVSVHVKQLNVRRHESIPQMIARIDATKSSVAPFQAHDSTNSRSHDRAITDFMNDVEDESLGMLLKTRGIR